MGMHTCLYTPLYVHLQIISVQIPTIGALAAQDGLVPERMGISPFVFRQEEMGEHPPGDPKWYLGREAGSGGEAKMSPPFHLNSPPITVSG